jgi:hypothetical protein
LIAVAGRQPVAPVAGLLLLGVEAPLLNVAGEMGVIAADPITVESDRLAY